MKIASTLKKISEKTQWLIEMTLAFLLADILNRLFYAGDMGFLRTPLHPYWIIILLIASKYGFVAGFVSGLTALAHFLGFWFGDIPSRLALEKFAEQGGLFLPLSFVAVGVVLGSLRQEYIQKEKNSEVRHREAQQMLTRMKELYEAGEKERRVLESRIVGQTTTLKMIYGEIQKFETLDLEAVYQGCLDILSANFEVQKASLYLKEGSDYVLKKATGWQEAEMVEGRVPSGGHLMDIVFEENRVITIQDIVRRKDADRYVSQYGKVLAMIPIRGEKEGVLGVVNVEKIDFLALTLPNLELMELVVGWVSKVAGNIEYVEGLKRAMFLDPEDGIFTSGHFEDALRNEFNRAKISRQPLTVCFLKIEKFGFMALHEKEVLKKTLLANLKRFFSEIDLIFHYRFEGIYAVVCPLKTEKDVLSEIRRVAGEMEKIGGRILFYPCEFKEEAGEFPVFFESVLAKSGLR